MTPHHFAQWAQQMPVKFAHYGVERLGEHRVSGVQSHSHAQPLGALAGEDEHRLTRRSRRAPNNRAAQLVTRQLIEPGQQPITVPANHHRPMLKNRTTRQRPPHIGNIEAIIATHVRGQPSRLPPQRRLRLRRHHPRHHRPRPTSLPPRHHRHRLDNHMRISATNPKRRHPRTTRPSTSRPHPRRGQQLHRPRRPIHMRARHIHVQRRRQQLMAHRQHHLDHPGHPRRGLRMTHIRLHRPQPQRFSRLPPILPISGQQRLSLNRIPQRGPGPMPLHHIHLGRAQPGIGQRRPHHPLLRRTIRRGQPIRRPILINRRPDHHRQHRMTQPPRIRKPLQHQHPTALGESGAVGRRGECLAAPVRG